MAAQAGSDYEEDLSPVLEDADDLSQVLGAVWTDGLPGGDYDHQCVVHDDGYVSDQ